MLRRFPQVALTLALLFAAEPLLHTHPLQSAGSSASHICAVCAASVDRPAGSPAVAAPLAVVTVVADAPPAIVRASAPLLLASRAPPRLA